MAQHIFWPIQPTNRYNPNSLRPPTLPVSHEQQPPGVRGALLPHPPGATCDAARRRGRRRPRAMPPTRRPPVLLPHGLSSASAAPARPLLRRPCSPTASPPPLLLTIGLVLPFPSMLLHSLALVALALVALALALASAS